MPFLVLSKHVTSPIALVFLLWGTAAGCVDTASWSPGGDTGEDMGSTPNNGNGADAASASDASSTGSADAGTDIGTSTSGATETEDQSGDGPFEVVVQDAEGNVFTLECQHDEPARGYNIYDKSQTTTYWSTSNWHPATTTDTSMDAYRLGYYRESYPTLDNGSLVSRGKAYGGRCITPMTTALSGNGELSARVFIGSNVLNENTHGKSSTAVFTIGLWGNASGEHKWDLDYEFDLAVMNLVQNGGNPQIKYGWASHGTHGIDLIRVVSRWVILKAAIADDPDYSESNRKRCEITIEDEATGQLLSWDGPDWVPCSLPAPGATATEGWIILNSRARDPEDGAWFENPEDDQSMIIVDWIKWIQE